MDMVCVLRPEMYLLRRAKGSGKTWGREEILRDETPREGVIRLRSGDALSPPPFPGAADIRP